MQLHPFHRRKFPITEVLLVMYIYLIDYQLALEFHLHDHFAIKDVRPGPRTKRTSMLQN